ncbi:hypothetical protein [Allorhizocola rhizosphaerae]|uniref:hypothetical protein n=1 Tax=Allorhizocola rhizosphaerae TaxID=1872709 RepID=UPI000E3D8EC9|nr:hypothetical protein [Allorhizocola rhizosphaerae]
MSTPPLLLQLLDDAAVFPPGSATLPDALESHREYRASWYADLVGPLLVPASQVKTLSGMLRPDETITVGVIADGIALGDLFRPLTPRGLVVRQVEAPVARRGEDPQPTLRRLIELLQRYALSGFAEVPLAWGLLGALDTIAEARQSGLDIAAKFRTGGLAAELFPTPQELAAVIRACFERKLPFKLTAGLHSAIRHSDPETGFTHHGFINILAAVCLTNDGAETGEVASVLASTQPLTLIEAIRPFRNDPRPLWQGFGTCSIAEPVADMQQLGLVGP